MKSNKLVKKVRKHLKKASELIGQNHLPENSYFTLPIKEDLDNYRRTLKASLKQIKTEKKAQKEIKKSLKHDMAFAGK